MNVQPFFDPFPTIDLGDIILREITKEDAQAYLDYMSNDQMAGFLTSENRPKTVDIALEDGQRPVPWCRGLRGCRRC